MSVARWARCLPAAAALALWRLSLTHVRVSHLGSYGLPPALGPGWYAALAISVLGAAAAVSASRASGAVAGVYIVAAAIILYGTVPVLSGPPQYAWVYKHIGVVRYLESHGRVDPAIDIYNRWPGFFALGAVFSFVAGHADPEAYASWAELFFVLLDIALIFTAVRAVARSTNVAAGAALLFVITDWVGQDYFSPQAFSYVLALALIAVALANLRVPEAGRAPWPGRLLERLARRPQLPQGEVSGAWPRGVAIGTVLALDAVIVASHQLTPYMLLGGFALLMLAGIVRPWWMLALMAAMTLGYLAANLGYIERHFGLVTSIDPFNNVQKVYAYNHAPAAGKTFNALAERYAAFLLYGAGLAAAAYLLRRGLLGRALPFLLLAMAPFGIAFGQDYGGEAPLRIVLFSSPWWAALIAWAVATVGRRWERLVLMSAIAAVFTALFVPSFFGQEQLDLVSRGEVQASGWFYAHARRGAVLVLAAPGFPLKYGGDYPQFEVPEAEGAAYPAPPLVNARAFRYRQLGSAQVRRIAAIIKGFPHYGYLAFSKDQDVYAETFELTPPGALHELEQAVAQSSDFRLWYGNADARIYEFVAPSASASTRTGLNPRALRAGALAASRERSRGHQRAGRGGRHDTRAHAPASF